MLGKQEEREKTVNFVSEDYLHSLERLVGILREVDVCLGDILPELEGVTGARFEKRFEGVMSHIRVTCVSPVAIKDKTAFIFTISPSTGEILFRGMGLVRKRGKVFYPYRRKLEDADRSLLKSAVFFLVDEWFMKNWKM